MLAVAASNLSGSRRATSLSNFIINGPTTSTHIAHLLGASAGNMIIIILMHNIIIIVVGSARHALCLWTWVSVCVHIVSVCVCVCVHTPCTLHLVLGVLACVSLSLSLYECVCVCVQSVLTALQSTVYSNWIFARDFRSLNPTAKSRKAATTTATRTAMATTTTNDGAEQRL